MSRREKDEAALRFIEEVTSRCDEVQRAVLAQILSRNAETEYLKRHGMNGCVDMETFKNKIPVVTYEDIHSDIQRIANGDFSPLLCAQPITEFLTRCVFLLIMYSSFLLLVRRRLYYAKFLRWSTRLGLVGKPQPLAVGSGKKGN